MVAPGVIPKSQRVPIPSAMVRTLGYGPVRFTLNDAISMIEDGIIPEDGTVELLDGVLVYRDRFDLRGNEVVEGTHHNYVISALAELNVRINNSQRQLRTQSTLVCSETHAPIPDAIVLRGTLRDYRDRLPQAADAYCVIEVADSSYERDSGEKLVACARANIRQYIIINLRTSKAEVYTEPDAAAGTYAPSMLISGQEKLAIRIGENDFLEITLAEILP